MWPGKDLHIAFTWSPCLEALFYTLSRCSQSFGCWNGGRKILVSYLVKNGAATSSNTRWSSVDKSNKKMLIPFIFLTATLPNVALQMLCTTVLLSIVLLHCYSFKFRSNRWSLLPSWQLNLHITSILFKDMRRFRIRMQTIVLSYRG